MTTFPIRTTAVVQRLGTLRTAPARIAQTASAAMGDTNLRENYPSGFGYVVIPIDELPASARKIMCNELRAALEAVGSLVALG
jgi:hypothetical protein